MEINTIIKNILGSTDAILVRKSFVYRETNWHDSHVRPEESVESVLLDLVGRERVTSVAEDLVVRLLG